MAYSPTDSVVKGGAIGRHRDACVPTAPALNPALGDWNDTAAEYPRHNLCLHQLIEEQSARTPDRPAVAFEQRKLTYRELDRRAIQLAARLRSLGAGPDVLVGLLVERSLEMVVGVLGILKAGAAYLPIDASYPQERIAFMLEDANSKLLVTQTSLLGSAPASAAQTVCLDSFAWADAQEATRADAQCSAANLAYAIYTSGSTGRPKGVGIQHGNIVNYVLGVSERLQLKPGMNHAMVSTVAADLGNTVLFPALATGGCLHMVSQERAQSQALLSEYFKRENIDVLKIVPSHLAALQTGRNPEQVMPRKRLILGGEASRLEWVERLRALSPDCEIYNHYGPTETTVGVLTYHVGPQLPSTRSGTLPLGRPLPGCRVYVLDERGKPLPPDVEGELFIAGSGVARGYLNRPDLTEQKFVPDPFGPEPGGRMYRTGDLGRYLPDGNIEFRGRIDDQVKVHGYRIELGEIENALREHAGVRDALVLAGEDGSGNKQLVAYVAPKRASQPLWENRSLYLLPDGSPIAHLNKQETDSAYDQIFVRQAWLRHGIAVQDGDFILDVGAGIGLFEVFANRVARNPRIISLEPDPAAFACLKANAEAWGPAVKCLPFGIARESKSAEAEFFEALAQSPQAHHAAEVDFDAATTLASDRWHESQGNERFAGEIGEPSDERLLGRAEFTRPASLSGVIATEGIDRIDLLTIHATVNELDVLPDLTPSEWAKIRQLVIQVDQRQDLDSTAALLKQHGYEVLVERDAAPGAIQSSYLYATRPSGAGPGLLPEPLRAVRPRSLSCEDQQILTPATLRNKLKKSLPQYMVPAAFVLLKKFPLTANGKIDRKALPVPTHETAQPSRDFVSPQSETERALATIWSELLKVEKIGIHDNFFDLGGHSLMAMRLASRVRDLFEVDLPLATLLEAPTIAELAAFLRKDHWEPSWSSLVPIRTAGTKPPLFLMHSHGGNVLEYHSLVKRLEPDQPVYGLQARGLDGHIVKESSLEEMASAYVAELRRFQPEGPYFLGGFCLGGYLALEAAQQLTAAGSEVALLIVIQSIHPDARRFNPRIGALGRWWRRTAKRISLEMENLSYRGKGYLMARCRHAWDLVCVRTAIALNSAAPKDASDLSRLPKRYIVEALGLEHKKAMRKYVPRPYGGDVALFRASKQLSGLMIDEYLGWKRVFHGSLYVGEIPGHQQTLLQPPNVSRLAQELTSRLEAAQRHAGLR